MTAHDAELEPGTELDRYRVGYRIGDGSTGIVYQAMDEDRRCAVAILVLRPEVGADESLRDRLLEVARVQQQLDSEHVVRILETGVSDGRWWVASEIVADGNLAVLLDAKGPPPLALAVEYAAQVADGLAAAHAAGLVHGALGAREVLLEQREDEAFRARLTGFRSLRAHRVNDPAEDLRGMGALLWTLVSGDTTYAGRLADGQAPQLLPESAMAVEVNRVLRRALAPSAEDPPYRDAVELHAELARAASALDEPATGAPEPSPGPTASPAPVSRTTADPAAVREVALAAVLAVLLVVGAMVVAGLVV